MVVLAAFVACNQSLTEIMPMAHGDKNLFTIIAAAALFLACAWQHPVMAQALASQPDGPVACDAFQRVGNGSWTVLRPTSIYPAGAALSLAPGQAFAPNQMVDDVEVTAVLDRNCGNR